MNTRLESHTPATGSESEAQIMERYRTDRRLSKIEFARALDVSRQRAGNWLSGRYVPASDWLKTIAGLDDWRGDMAKELLQTRISKLTPDSTDEEAK